jgi:hypothetical protein
MCVGQVGKWAEKQAGVARQLLSVPPYSESPGTLKWAVGRYGLSWNGHGVSGGWKQCPRQMIISMGAWEKGGRSDPYSEAEVVVKWWWD